MICDPYPALTAAAETLADGLGKSFADLGLPATVNRAGSLLSVFFTDAPVRDFGGAMAADHARFGRFFHHALDRGVWLPPSGYELWTLGTEHGPEEIERVVDAASSFGG